ncbi:hypothetical protein TNCV_3180091 [Trichonephila clavipes]|nr:hypothetical protein TNCV_3180091 [Trichonephila clavipes]
MILLRPSRKRDEALGQDPVPQCFKMLLLKKVSWLNINTFCLTNLTYGQTCQAAKSVVAQTSSRWYDVSSSSLDHGSKLRGPSPKVLE